MDVLPFHFAARDALELVGEDRSEAFHVLVFGLLQEVPDSIGNRGFGVLHFARWHLAVRFRNHHEELSDLVVFTEEHVLLKQLVGSGRGLRACAAVAGVTSNFTSDDTSELVTGDSLDSRLVS